MGHQDLATGSITALSRRYDKGERRHKHNGSRPVPDVVFERGHPRRAIGKCPNNVAVAQAQAALGSAIPIPSPSLPPSPSERLYTTHLGVIYECRTSDRGVTYHAYPFHGTLPSDFVAALRARLTTAAERSAFDSWNRQHVRTL